MRSKTFLTFCLSIACGLSAVDGLARAQEPASPAPLTAESPANASPSNVVPAPAVDGMAPPPGVAPSTPAATGDVEAVSDPDEPQMETDIHTHTFPNRPLLITGSVVLAGSYVPAVIGGALSDRKQDQKLYIPVAGPWMSMNRGDQTAATRTLLTLDGIAQGAGALAMVISLVIPERTTKNWYLIGSNRPVHLTSQRVPRGFGLGASARF